MKVLHDLDQNEEQWKLNDDCTAYGQTFVIRYLEYHEPPRGILYYDCLPPNAGSPTIIS